ncbi:DUF927 domain-containing protein [Paracoccus gahaiensis]|nr:DUF927 domain-containing protein [Paracoccus gahaiensis]
MSQPFGPNDFLTTETLPGGYFVADEKIFIGGKKPQFLARTFAYLGLARNAGSSNWEFLLGFNDPDGVGHVVRLPTEHLAGDGKELWKLLLRAGYFPPVSRAARVSFLSLLQELRSDRRVLIVDRSGWVDGTFRQFVLPNGETIGCEEEVLLAENLGGASRGYGSAGILADWQASIAGPSKDNKLLIFVLSAALASVLLWPAHMDGGGFNLKGRTTAGKTTALRTAMSIWASHLAIETWRATDNGLEGIAALGNHVALIVDELGKADPRVVAQAVYMLANGEGKRRADVEGVATAARRWQVLFISSGELGLREMLASDTRKAQAGQFVRLVDVPVDGDTHGVFSNVPDGMKPSRFAKSLRRGAAASYGTAGPAFVAELIRSGRLAEFDDEFERHKEQLMRKLNGHPLTPQQERVFERFALISLAGSLATEFGVTGWGDGEIVQMAVLSFFRKWREEDEQSSGVSDTNAAIVRVREFLLQHERERFVTTNFSVPRYMAGYSDDEAFYILENVWRDEIHKGHDPMRAARSLLDHGFLSPEGPRRLKAKVPTGLNGDRIRAFRILRSILREDDDASVELHGGEIATEQEPDQPPF